MEIKNQQKLLEFRGIQAFEKKENFHKWLNMPSNALGDKVPAKLIETEEGLQQVLDELIRIEHGVY